MLTVKLADAVVLFHLVYILFSLVGGLLGLWRRWILWIHLPAAIWAASVELFNLPCPLTPFENRLRASAGYTEYEISFVERYLLPVLYPDRLTETHQVLLGVFVIVLNVGIYSYIVNKHRRNS